MAKVIFQHNTRSSARSKFSKMGFGGKYGECGFAHIKMTQNPSNDLEEMQQYKEEGVWFITLDSTYHSEETMNDMYEKNCKNWKNWN